MTTPSKFTIGLVQMRCGLDPRENLDKAVARVRDAAREGAQVVCLFCVEGIPEACHRSLVAEKLSRDLGLPVEHIRP